MTVTQYVERVRAALADLPPHVRDELLDDLPAHLAEVAAESDEPLESRLGSPEAYAAELRAAADLAPRRRRFAGARRAGERLATAVVARVRGPLGEADARIGPLIGYDRVSTFGRQLRPGWWVVRGYLAAMAVVYLLDDQGGSIGLLPRLGGSTLAALVILGGFVGASIWFGQRGGRLPVWPRRALTGGTALLLLFALGGFVTADRWTRGAGYRTQYVNANPYDGVADVYVYDAQGRLLQDVRLLDQDGQPIVLGWPWWCDRPEVPEISDRNLYPRCPQYAPFNRPVPTPSVTAAPTPTPSAAPTTTPSATPTTTPSAAPTTTGTR